MEGALSASAWEREERAIKRVIKSVLIEIGYAKDFREARKREGHKALRS
jgi:hypothetical protein